jgi:hypothetical protein
MNVTSIIFKPINHWMKGLLLSSVYLSPVGRKSIGLTGDIPTSRKSGMKEAKAKERRDGDTTFSQLPASLNGDNQEGASPLWVGRNARLLAYFTHGSRQARVAIFGGQTLLENNKWHEWQSSQLSWKTRKGSTLGAIFMGYYLGRTWDHDFVGIERRQRLQKRGRKWKQEWR